MSLYCLMRHAVIKQVLNGISWSRWEELERQSGRLEEQNQQIQKLKQALDEEKKKCLEAWTMAAEARKAVSLAVSKMEEQGKQLSEAVASLHQKTTVNAREIGNANGKAQELRQQLELDGRFQTDLFGSSARS